LIARHFHKVIINY